ncbi:hypothetical protein KIN20_024010 [Parelaphostrongylus tenuis]|uniref:Uncharacterized protein n=1 Tax=Parelaphostrongylus tenuis TaxID=148309 RepID=A0AAD5MSS5_PARTN|nr:hypothetical protein KIN20_024010 [Parelaphostrongylus tenuis]
MRAFVNGGGYWLCVPKPWNGRKFVTDSQQNFDNRSKSKKIEDIIRRLASARKRQEHQCQLRYREGRSLFVLPKALSKGVRQWKDYESRFKQWLEDNDIRKCCTTESDGDRLAYVNYSQCGSNESRSRHNSSFEEDPLRAFYTITIQIQVELDLSRKIDCQQQRRCLSIFIQYGLATKWSTPKGGVSGRIDDPSSMSAKARATLHRWSRIVSQYDIGNESGDDEDPVDMWNRSIGTSIAYQSPDVLPAASCTPLCKPPQKRMHSLTEISKNHGVPENPSPADEAFPTVETDENSPIPACSPGDSSNVTPSPESYTPVGFKQVKGEKTKSLRRSNRIQFIKCLQNTPSPKATSTPRNKEEKAQRSLRLQVLRRLVHSRSTVELSEGNSFGSKIDVSASRS